MAFCIYVQLPALTGRYVIPLSFSLGWELP